MSHLDHIPSLWHGCLYGVGSLACRYDSNMELAPTFYAAVTELDSRLLKLEAAVNAQALGSGLEQAQLEQAQHELQRCRYYQVRLTGGGPHINSLLREYWHTPHKQFPDAAALSERSKYEILANYSMLVSLPQFEMLEDADLNTLLDFYDEMLDGIHDPFLYARASALVFFHFPLQEKSPLIRARVQNIIEKHAERLLSDIPVLKRKQTDGAHSSYAYVVFAASVIGQVLVRTLALGGADKPQHNLLVNVLLGMAEAFFSRLDDNCRASQFTFYNLLRTQTGSNRDISEHLFGKVVNAYVQGGDHQSSYAYLRAAYLLFESSRSKYVIHENHMNVLTDILQKRVQAMFHGGKAPSANRKYDNDVLCWCYAYVLTQCYSSPSLIKSVIEASDVLTKHIESVPNIDLFKLLNCYLIFFKDQPELCQSRRAMHE